MKLIHCADLHLDSPLQTHLSPEKARQRNRELLQSFCRLADYAAENHVSGVLISGDLFDGCSVDPTTLSIVFMAIRKASPIPFLYLPGNHDPRICLSGAPENLKVIGQDWCYFAFEKVTVAAIAPEAPDWNTFYQRLSLDPRRVNILMLHGQVASQTGPDLICLPLLRNRGIRYAALGHIHSFQQFPLEPDGFACYSGCLEGRGFDETGEKGFVELTIEGDFFTGRFVPFATRTLHRIPVDITGLSDIHQILTAAETALKGIASGDMVSLVLTGTSTLQTQKDPAFLKQMLSGRFFALTLSDESRLGLSPEEYAHSVSLQGAFIRLVMEGDLPEADKEQVIRLGLAALEGRRDLHAAP